MDTPKLMKFSFKFKNGDTGALMDDEFTVLEGASSADLNAWLSQEVKCPCRPIPISFSGFPLDPHFLQSILPHYPDCVCAGTGTLTLGALVQKLEAK